jgi:hypothetical protein
MTDESSMVRIWLGTQNIPPIMVYAKKVLTPEGMLMLLKMALTVAFSSSMEVKNLSWTQ